MLLILPWRAQCDRIRGPRSTCRHCQTFEGGIAGEEGLEAHGGALSRDGAKDEERATQDPRFARAGAGKREVGGSVTWSLRDLCAPPPLPGSPEKTLQRDD